MVNIPHSAWLLSKARNPIFCSQAHDEGCVGWFSGHVVLLTDYEACHLDASKCCWSGAGIEESHSESEANKGAAQMQMYHFSIAMTLSHCYLPAHDVFKQEKAVGFHLN